MQTFNTHIMFYIIILHIYLHMSTFVRLCCQKKYALPSSIFDHHKVRVRDQFINQQNET